MQTKKTIGFRAVLTEYENALYLEYASLLGVGTSTAIKMHLRETLPQAIEKEKASRAEKNPQSVEEQEQHSKPDGDCQDKSKGAA